MFPRVCATTLWAASLSLVALLILLVSGLSARADMDAPLETRLVPEVVSTLFPDAASLGGFDSDPPVAQVMDGDGKLLGYIFSTHETVQPAGFAGASFDIVVAMNAEGVLIGHVLLEQYEPLVHKGMVPPEDVSTFLRALDGSQVSSNRRAPTGDLDGVAGVTISAMTMHQAILASALKIGHLKGVLQEETDGLALDTFGFTEKDWPTLVADGSVGRMAVPAGVIRAAHETIDDEKRKPLRGLPEDDDAPAIELFAAVATTPSVGRNLFGPGGFREVNKYAQKGEQQLFVGSVGPYRWVPLNLRKVKQFDQLRLVQEGTVIPLLTEHFNRSRHLAAGGAPTFDYSGRFGLPRETGFDPLKPWTLELVVGNHVFGLPHQVPADQVLGSDFDKEQAGLKPIQTALLGMARVSTLNNWQLRWLDNKGPIAILLALLLAVTLVMVFQHRLTQWRVSYRVIRIGLLLVTLGWLGWWTGNQLTILTVINYAQLALTDGQWATLLFDPLMVILSVYVLITLILWGRGVFCGWLCPFGALQELLNQAARALRVPQVAISHALHERLWGIKYVAVAGLGVAAVFSMETATTLSEVEPFKTAISVHFMRAWPYVVYAGLLLLVGLFIERAFCRFLCPLGAALAIMGRIHALEWLPRRPQCGNPCQICRNSCPVGAVDPAGKINISECFQCLDCQVDYNDVTRCPPLVSRQRRLKALAT